MSLYIKVGFLLVVSCFLNQSDNLGLLIGVFRLFIFNAIVDMVKVYHLGSYFLFALSLLYS